MDVPKGPYPIDEAKFAERVRSMRATFAIRYLAMRLCARRSLSDLAHAAGISPVRLAMIEQGQVDLLFEEEWALDKALHYCPVYRDELNVPEPPPFCYSKLFNMAAFGQQEELEE